MGRETTPVRAFPILATAAAAFALLVVLVSPSQGARAVTPSCGDTITTSVRLVSDLVGCTSTGLIVGAAGITIDLDGHTVGGTNVPKSVGIENDGHASVRIVNGTVKNFHVDGIAIQNARGNTISKVTVTGIGAGGKENDADAGILLDHSPAAVVSDSVVTNHVHAYQSDGIDVLFSSGALIQRNRLSQNAWDGLAVIKSPRSRIVGNELDGNANNGMEANGSDFIHVSGNHADQNRQAGIVVGALAHARVLDNSVTGNGEDGLSFFDLKSSFIHGNRASANANGIHLHGGQHGSMLNQIVGNTAVKNRQVGIWMHGDTGTVNGPADQNLVAGNTATGNGSQGGIVVEGPAHGNRLRGNTATRNAGHGIAAVTGTVDGGGNHAHGNRLAPQCIGVACS